MTLPAQASLPDSVRWQRLLGYYRECLSEEEGVVPRCRPADLGSSWLPLSDAAPWALQAEWQRTDLDVLRLPLDGPIASFAGSLRKSKSTADLYYGWPLYVETGKNGETAAVPLLLVPVEARSQAGELHVRRLPGWPRLHPTLLGHLAPTPEEQRYLLAELGLLDAAGDPHVLTPAAILDRLRPWLDAAQVIEPLDPDQLVARPPITELKRPGWYDRAVLVLGERPPFTRGLSVELERLHDGAPGPGDTALAALLTDGRTARREVDALLPVEVVPLNEEQRQAVRMAFEQPLTVVTGPPGTGKSQVVVSVLANAWLRGEKVLFSSRNHRAVDVVEQRLHRLAGQPLAVRAGRRSGDRDLRANLLQLLTRLLSVTAAETDRQDAGATAARVAELATERAALWVEADAIGAAWQRLANLEGDRERLRAGLDDATWHALAAMPADLEALATCERQVQPLRTVTDRFARWWHRSRDEQRIRDALGPHAVDDPAEALRRLQVAPHHVRHALAVADLHARSRLDELARRLAHLDRERTVWGARLLQAHARLLPDRLAGGQRRVLAEFRATTERLLTDQLGGPVVARLLGEQERLFAGILPVLPVWCVTNLSVRGSLPLQPALFDLVVLDEASQCDIASALPLLYRAKRALIIGDPQQLRHVATAPRHRDQLLQERHGLTAGEDQPFAFANNSLFDLAMARVPDGGLITLREHFRSHGDIVGYANRHFYDGHLQVCTDSTALLADGESGVRWTQVQGPIVRPGQGGALAPDEVEAVVSLLIDLLQERGFAGTVGVVTPFRAQANRIRERLGQRLDLALVERSRLLVETAHGFQGDERDVLFLSPCVGRTMPDGARRFLGQTANLFNVAVTRARAVLHVVGDQAACASSGIPHIEAFAAHVAALTAARVATPPELTGPAVGHWEKPLHDALVHAGLHVLPQYAVAPYRLDLAVVQGDLRLAIEVDGAAWHLDWDGARCRRDLVRDQRLQTQGWRVVRFWATEVRDDLAGCVAKVVAMSAIAG